MIIREKISREQLDKLFDEFYGTMLKFAVDVEKGALAAGCEYHIDCAEELAEEGSVSQNLWGANLRRKDSTIDYVSLINIKPMANNRSMEIKNEEIKKKVEEITKKLLCD